MNEQSSGSGVRRAGPRRGAVALLAGLLTLGLAHAPSAELFDPVLDFPLVAFDNQGTTAYDADSDVMLVLTRPLSIRLDAGMVPITIDPTLTLSELLNIAVRVDESGALVGGVPGDDLALTGQVDLDGDGLEDFAGLLLTGEALAFGFADSGGTTDSYDFLFEVTGGLLATLFSGADVAVVVSSEFSDFSGDFSVSFGGEAKGTLGSSVPDVEPPCLLDLDASCEVVGAEARPRWDCRGDVKRLVFEYTAQGCEGTTQDQWGHVQCEGGADGASPVDIVVRNAAGDVVGDFGDVATGDRIEIADDDMWPVMTRDGSSDWDWQAHEGIGRHIEISVAGSLEVVRLNTSCGKPLNAGDSFGSFRLQEITTTRGGTVTAPEPGETPSHCVVEGAPPAPHCVGRIETLGLRYLGGGCQEGQNDQGGSARCEGDADELEPVRIVVRDGRGSKSGFGDDVVRGGGNGTAMPPDLAEEYAEAEREVERCEAKLVKAVRKKREASTDSGLRRAKRSLKRWKRRHADAVASRDELIARVARWAPAGGAGWVPPGHRPDKPGKGRSKHKDKPGKGRSKHKDKPWKDDGKPGIGNSFTVLFDSGEEASVMLGDVITIDTADTWERVLPPQMIVEVYAEAGDLVQKLLLHTSCSEPLDLGDRFGSVEVVSLDTTKRRPVSLGQEVKITYTVGNPNDFEIFDVAVSDDLFGELPGSPLASLVSGASSSLSATAFVTESLVNVGLATADDGAGDLCGPAEAVTKIRVVPADPPPDDDDDHDQDEEEDDDHDDDD